ncbi:hypothetical protein ACJX0J_019614, partial [Zea mays]
RFSLHGFASRLVNGLSFVSCCSQNQLNSKGIHHSQLKLVHGNKSNFLPAYSFYVFGAYISASAIKTNELYSLYHAKNILEHNPQWPSEHLFIQDLQTNSPNLYLYYICVCYSEDGDLRSRLSELEDGSCDFFCQDMLLMFIHTEKNMSFSSAIALYLQLLPTDIHIEQQLG